MSKFDSITADQKTIAHRVARRYQGLKHLSADYVERKVHSKYTPLMAEYILHLYFNEVF